MPVLISWTVIIIVAITVVKILNKITCGKLSKWMKLDED